MSPEAALLEAAVRVLALWEAKGLRIANLFEIPSGVAAFQALADSIRDVEASRFEAHIDR